MYLKKIVPEHHSKNIFVKKLFLKCFEAAIKLAQPKSKFSNNLKVVDLGCGESILLKLIEKKF